MHVFTVYAYASHNRITMNAANTSICFVFFSLILFQLQTNFIRDCDSFLLDTNLGKFIWNVTNVNGSPSPSPSMAPNESFRLSKEKITSAFNGFLKIVDDPMVIKRSSMNYNIPDVVRSEGFVENVCVRHLKNATLDDVYISNDQTYVKLNLSLSLLKVTGLYNMTFHLDRYNISIYGNGSFVLQFNNLALSLNATLEDTTQGYVVLSGIVCNQTLNGGAFVQVRNLLDDEEVSKIFSENLSVLVPALHNAFKPMIDEFMGPALMSYGRTLFFNTKRADLQTIIDGFARHR